MFGSDNSRWLCFMTTEIGGNLSRVHHLYYYKDFDTRDEVLPYSGVALLPRLDLCLVLCAVRTSGCDTILLCAC